MKQAARNSQIVINGFITHRESQQQTGFSHTAVPNQDELEEIVVVALLGGGTGRHGAFCGCVSKIEPFSIFLNVAMLRTCIFYSHEGWNSFTSSLFRALFVKLMTSRSPKDRSTKRRRGCGRDEDVRSFASGQEVVYMPENPFGQTHCKC